MTMGISTQILLNPNAHYQSVSRAWQTHQRKILRSLAPAEVVLAESFLEAKTIVKAGALKGVRRFIAVGGPELMHGLINAVMELSEPHRETLLIGELSLFRPVGMNQTLAMPTSIQEQLAILEAGHTLPVDIGRVEWVDAKGAPQDRYFLNGAGFLLGGRILGTLSNWKVELPKSLDEATNIFENYWEQLSPVVSIESEGKVLYEGRCPALLVMGGRFYNKMGEVAPKANPNDGSLEVVWQPAKRGVGSVLGMAHLLIPGTNGFKKANRAKAQNLQISSRQSPVMFEADGIPTGQLPANFSVVPRALPLITPYVGGRVKKPVFKKLSVPNGRELAGTPRAVVQREASNSKRKQKIAV